jgi:DNA repair protein RadC
MIQTKQEYPYERFETYGPKALTDAELIAIILRTGTVGEDALALAHRVLDLTAGNRQGILALNLIPIEELMKIKGIGKVKAIRLKCVAEICARMQIRHHEQTISFTNPASVAACYMERMRHLETEHIYLILTDTKNRFMKEILLSKGTVNASLLSVREIFVEALRYHAVNILLLHNHPSGDCTPSREDIAITAQILEASRLLNVPLLDHIIIGDNTFTSLKEKGYL